MMSMGSGDRVENGPWPLRGEDEHRKAKAKAEGARGKKKGGQLFGTSYAAISLLKRSDAMVMVSKKSIFHKHHHPLHSMRKSLNITTVPLESSSLLISSLS